MKPLVFVSAAALVLAAGGALAQTPEIADGQTVRGRIDRNERLPEGEKAGDCYRFTLATPAEVTIVQRSRAFDSYVYVFDNDRCEGLQRHEDDDGDGDDGRNARLFRWMPAGTYSIGASAYEARSRGDYTLALSVEPDLSAPPQFESALTPPDIEAMIDDMVAWRETQEGPADPADPPAPINLPSLSQILAERQAEASPAPTPRTGPGPAPLPRPTLPPPPPPAAPAGPQRPYLRLDDAMIAFLSNGSPQRNGRPFICWNLPGSSRLEMRLGSEHPSRIELFDGADCPGAAIFSGAMSAGDVGYVLHADTSPGRPRSVGVSPAGAAMGVITLSAAVDSGGSGAPDGAPLRPAERVGSLAAPLDPAPVLGATEYTSDNATCRGAYDALAQYRGDGSLYSPRLSIVSNAEYRRRHGLVPVGAGEFADIEETIASANFFGALATVVMTPGDDETALHALFVAMQCDRRFGFTPVTEIPD